MTTQEQLTQVFNDNFVTYFRSFVAHVNVTGRNFRSDHKLLQGVYERRQAEIDVIAELIRSVGEFMPESLGRVLEDAKIATYEMSGDSDELLAEVRSDLEELKACFEELIAVADSEGYSEISNYAQEQVLDIAKSIWMLSATLD
jgi:starvation-inducible DNA-binding protein